MKSRPVYGGYLMIVSLLAALVLEIMPLPEALRDLRPQWLTLVLIYWCIVRSDRVGVGAAWLLGLTRDVLTGTLLGQNALGLAVIAFATLRLHQRLRIFPLLQQTFVVWVLAMLERLIELWVIGASGQPTPSPGYWLPPLTALIFWPPVSWTLSRLGELSRS